MRVNKNHKGRRFPLSPSISYHLLTSSRHAIWKSRRRKRYLFDRVRTVRSWLSQKNYSDRIGYLVWILKFEVCLPTAGRDFEVWVFILVMNSLISWSPFLAICPSSHLVFSRSLDILISWSPSILIPIPLSLYLPIFDSSSLRYMPCALVSAVSFPDSTGSLILKVDPFPTSLSASISPLWLWMIP